MIIRNKEEAIAVIFAIALGIGIGLGVHIILADVFLIY